MTISTKYTSGCACNSVTPVATTAVPTNMVSCCQNTVQAAPTPCCEAHNTQYVHDICLRPACSVVANADSFFLKFSNTCYILPIDGNHVFLYHPAVGFMTIVGVDEYGAYQVRLVDPSKAGGLIEKDSCVLLSAIPAASLTTTSRCLSGNFTVPAVNGTATIYIENGSGIPTGSTITFTANGETGSYQVMGFVSASGDIYAYTVQNTGSGHTPGTIIEGGCTGSCEVPIELITDVDLCDLSSSTVADSVVSCVNGAPRGFVSVSENSIVQGDGSGGWKNGTLLVTDCCVLLAGCLKFTGDTCTTGSDTVELQETGIECFEEAWAAVRATNPTEDSALAGGVGQTNMPMNINGFEVVVTDYDVNNRLVTLEPADPDILTPTTIIQFDEGDQLCLGECCESCINGPRTTNHRILPDEDNGVGGPQYASVYVYNSSGVITYEPGVKHHYLVGFDDSDPLTTTVLELDATYDDDPSSTGPGKPEMEDPLLFRNKMCHGDYSTKGCDVIIEAYWNYEFAFLGLPAGVRVHWEIAHYVSGAPTLADGSTINPFSSIASQANAAGYLEGPSSDDANTIIGNTAIGLAGQGNPKIFPYIAGSFKDRIYLEKCNCALGMVWFYVQTEVLSGEETDTIDLSLAVRQYFTIYDANESLNPRNNPEQEAFN